MRYERQVWSTMIIMDGFGKVYRAPIGKLNHLNGDSVCFYTINIRIHVVYGPVQCVNISKVSYTIWIGILANERINYTLSPHMILMDQIFESLLVDMNWDATFRLQCEIHITNTFKYATNIQMYSSIIKVDENSIALTQTRVSCKILEILMNQVVAVANDLYDNTTIIIMLIIVSCMMYLF